MAIPDWQLPPGVDRGLLDYFRSSEMVGGYDEQMAASPLARADVAFCERIFDRPGKLVDLGCGTGRLCLHFAKRGFECVGVDLSPEMLARARENATAAGVSCEWRESNLVELQGVPEAEFDFAACLFSTLGMVRGAENRSAVLASVGRVLRPGGHFVVHAHHRYFPGLGWKRRLQERMRTLLGASSAGDVTMPQAYGGAPLTLHHFTRRELENALETARFRIDEFHPIDEFGNLDVPMRSAYGFLVGCTRTG